nr:hypothetical protein [Paenibacillus riograndensis]
MFGMFIIALLNYLNRNR